MDKYAVIGNPIEHSKSPQIHAAFAKQEGVSIDYQRILATEDTFTSIVEKFFSDGGKGLNVTVPFKVRAYQQCNELNEYAKSAMAVNTLRTDQALQIIGSNTDGVGLLRDLQNNLGVNLKNKNILILGAGGATRGIVLPLLKQQPKQIIIANRTIEKATMLADAFKKIGKVQGCGFDQINNDVFDVVLNATSASLNNELPPISDHIVDHKSVCYDLAYSDKPTAFIDWANHQGVHSSHDGIGMLIEQAAESYFIWRGFKPSTQEVFEILRPKHQR